MINVINVTKKFKDKIIFENINFCISKCGVYLVDGESGVGKSTLFNIIANLSKYEGRIINDHLNSLSYVCQNNFLINHLNVKENLNVFNIGYEKLNKFGLKNKLNESVNNLSTGEKARLSLLLGLYSDNELILIDEPITNLDKKNSKKVVHEIFKVSLSKIVLVISHEKELFLNRVSGILKIQDQKVIFKDNSKNEVLTSKIRKKFNIDKNYIKKEFNYYKKDNLKIYAFIFFAFFLIFLILLVNNFLITRINKDIENSVDYNKFYLGECETNDDKIVKIEYCTNPSESTLKMLNKEEIKVGYNYDYLLSFLYKRDDLSVVSNKNIKLDKGKYPSSAFEVITSNKYRIGETINLTGDLLISGKKSDVYYKEVSLIVVGIYTDLTFLNDNNIYFDYDLIENYYKKEMLINNKISIYDYFINLDIEEYKYIGFSNGKIECLSMKGIKYDFYSNLLNVYTNINDLLIWLEIVVFIYFFIVISRFNTSRLKIKQRSNALLISNAFPILKSILISNYIDIIYVSIIYLIFTSILLLLSINIFVVTLLYVLLLFSLNITTYLYYSKKNVSNLLREEIW